jgi:hypothetical protein
MKSQHLVGASNGYWMLGFHPSLRTEFQLVIVSDGYGNDDVGAAHGRDYYSPFLQQA